jgi:hypothetical protein
MPVARTAARPLMPPRWRQTPASRPASPARRPPPEHLTAGIRQCRLAGADTMQVSPVERDAQTSETAGVRSRCSTPPGGGALGAYQAGVYEALAEANLHPDWVAGISIGAINATIIAGNPPNLRVEKLREFWEGITNSWFDVGSGELGSLLAPGDSPRGSINHMSAVAALMSGFIPLARSRRQVTTIRRRSRRRLSR